MALASSGTPAAASRASVENFSTTSNTQPVWRSTTTDERRSRVKLNTRSSSQPRHRTRCRYNTSGSSASAPPSCALPPSSSSPSSSPLDPPPASEPTAAAARFCASRSSGRRCCCCRCVCCRRRWRRPLKRRSAAARSASSLCSPRANEVAAQARLMSTSTSTCAYGRRGARTRAACRAPRLCLLAAPPWRHGHAGTAGAHAGSHAYARGHSPPLFCCSAPGRLAPRTLGQGVLQARARLRRRAALPLSVRHHQRHTVEPAPHHVELGQQVVRVEGPRALAARRRPAPPALEQALLVQAPPDLPTQTHSRAVAWRCRAAALRCVGRAARPEALPPGRALPPDGWQRLCAVSCRAVVGAPCRAPCRWIGGLGRCRP